MRCTFEQCVNVSAGKLSALIEAARAAASRRRELAVLGYGLAEMRSDLEGKTLAMVAWGEQDDGTDDGTDDVVTQ